MSGTLRTGKLALVGFALISSYLCLLVAALPTKECNKSQCKGPLRYYEELKCLPVYEKPGDFCAVRYDCSHLSDRSADKCYANGREYAIGDHLKDEDRSSPCDISCTCVKGYKDVAEFVCATVDCFNMHVKEGCYFKRTLDSCCGGEEVCPKSGEEEKVKCEIDGKTYLDGQAFYPTGYPELSCICMEGYTGENVEPFCKPITCGTELRRNAEIRDNCVPVYYSSQPPRTSCSISFRCQNDNDTVIHPASETSPEDKAEKTDSQEVSDDMKCNFGNMTMRIGDELNQATDYSSVCVKCICEVPPAPTCQRLPDDECDVTNHPPFNN